MRSRNVLRAVVFFVVFYMLIPTASAFLAVRHHLDAQPNPRDAAIGLNLLFTMVPFYLYLAGALHYSKTNRPFLQTSLMRDAISRFFTWDVPCQVWVSGSLLIEKMVFHGYGCSCVLIFITMTFLFPVIAVLVAALSYVLMPKELRGSINPWG
jgi:hypothetical protein